MIFATRKNIEEIRRQAYEETFRQQSIDRRFDEIRDNIERLYERICVLEDKLNADQKNPCYCKEEDKIR